MELLYQISTVINRKCLKETNYVATTVLIRLTDFFAYIGIAFSCHCVVSPLADFYGKWPTHVFYIIVALMVIPFLCLSLSIPRLSIWKALRSCKKKYGHEETHRIARFYEQNFSWQHVEKGTTENIQYGELHKIKETDNFFVLITKSLSAFRVDKNRFEKGTADEFRLFIQKKVSEGQELKRIGRKK